MKNQLVKLANYLEFFKVLDCNVDLFEALFGESLGHHLYNKYMSCEDKFNFLYNLDFDNLLLIDRIIEKREFFGLKSTEENWLYLAKNL
jgi:hypothetical protein